MFDLPRSKKTFHYGNVRDALLSGDVDYIEYLLNSGIEWEGDRFINLNDVQFPTDAKLFAKLLKQILDLKLYGKRVTYSRQSHYSAEEDPRYNSLTFRVSLDNLDLHKLSINFPQILMKCGTLGFFQELYLGSVINLVVFLNNKDVSLYSVAFEDEKFGLFDVWEVILDSDQVLQLFELFQGMSLSV